ncbi:MAG: M23 family metallopeptidase [Achromobacter sp.]|nr:M23 family metallopeptidase [Achromobacter sp.]
MLRQLRVRTSAAGTYLLDEAMRHKARPAIMRYCLSLLLIVASAASIAQELAWPTTSRNVKQATTPFLKKAIIITGVAGSPITAAADGEVKYAGDGVKDLGNLVVIQHDNGLMTAYGNNQELFVQTGQIVKRGQKIATMGSTDATRVQLTFDVRLNGNPVDPMAYLPTTDAKPRSTAPSHASAGSSNTTGSGSTGAAYYLTRMKQPRTDGQLPHAGFGLIAANSESEAKSRTLDIENRPNRQLSLPLWTVEEVGKCKPGWAANLHITNGNVTARASAVCGLPTLQAAIQMLMSKCRAMASPAQCGGVPAQTGTAIFLRFVQIPTGKPTVSRIWGTDGDVGRNDLPGGYCLFQRDGMEQFFFVQGGSDSEMCRRSDSQFRFVVREVQGQGVLLRP